MYLLCKRFLLHYTSRMRILLRVTSPLSVSDPSLLPFQVRAAAGLGNSEL